jgi:hypothetical protein
MINLRGELQGGELQDADLQRFVPEKSRSGAQAPRLCR